MKNTNILDMTSCPNDGKYSALVRSYELVTPEDSSKKSYVLVTYAADGCEFDGRLYGGRVPYFLSCIIRQTKGATRGMPLSEVLDYLKKNSFDLWIGWDAEYDLPTFDWREHLEG